MGKKTTLRKGIVAMLLVSALAGGCGRNTPEAMVASAKEYLDDENYKAAAIQLKNALQQDPKLAEARFLLGQALVQTGDGAGAEIELRKALELGYDRAQVNPLLARALVMLGQHNKVIGEFTGARTDTPQGAAMLHTAIGQAHVALRAPDAAQAAFDAALAALPGYAPALLGNAYLKAAQRDLAAALALVDGVLKASPKNVEAQQFRADLLFAQGKPEEALQGYRNVLDIRPGHVPAHSAVVSLLMQQGKPDEAGKQLQAMKQAAPRHPQTAYLNALWNYRQKNLAAARDAIQQQLKLAPDNVPGLLLAAAIEQDQKSYAQAESHLQKALQQAPDSALARQMLVSGYLRSGQHGKALEIATPLLASAGNDPATLALAGEVYLMNGRPAEAARLFERASALDPQDGRKRTGLALSHLAQGDTKGGLRELEQAAADSSDTRADLALIAAHLQKRDFDAALAAIDRLDKKRPDEALTENLRGVALIGKKDVAAARKSFQRALALDPAFFPAAANLARLDLADKKPDEARKRFEAVLAKDPKSTQTWLALADLKRRSRGKPGEIAALIEKAVAANPADLASRLALIDHHLRAKDPQRAAAAAQDALAAIPERPALLAAAGRAQAAAGAYNQAMSTYGLLARMQPKSPLPLLRMAEIQIAEKEIPSAIRYLRRALEISPGLVPAQRTLIAIDVRSDRVKEAVAMAREVQRERPKDSIGYLLEGDVYGAKKQYRQALAAFQNGLRQAGTGDLAGRVDATMRLDGAHAQADSFSAGWLKDHPKDVPFLLYLAQSASARKDYQAAARHYRALVEIHPEGVAYLNNLAWTAAQTDDPKALEYAQKASELAPNQPTVLDTLGTILLKRGATAEGLEKLQRASALAPENPQLRLSLAKGLIQAGKKDQARKELDALARLGDGFAGQDEVRKLAAGL